MNTLRDPEAKLWPVVNQLSIFCLRTDQKNMVFLGTRFFNFVQAKQRSLAINFDQNSR
jgi:hypothetical protein